MQKIIQKCISEDVKFSSNCRSCKMSEYARFSTLYKYVKSMSFFLLLKNILLCEIFFMEKSRYLCIYPIVHRDRVSFLLHNVIIFFPLLCRKLFANIWSNLLAYRNGILNLFSSFWMLFRGAFFVQQICWCACFDFVNGMWEVFDHDVQDLVGMRWIQVSCDTKYSEKEAEP